RLMNRRPLTAKEWNRAPARESCDFLPKPIAAERPTRPSCRADLDNRRLVELVTVNRPVRLSSRRRACPECQVSLVRRNKRIGLAEGICMIARPTIIRRTTNNPGAHRIPLDVLVTRQQVLLGVDWCGAKSSLEEAADAALRPIEIGYVEPADGLHDAPDRPRSRGRN